MDELYVEPAHRGHGIGQALLQTAYAVAAAQGAVTLDLEVDAAHWRVEGLYNREGFARVDRARWQRPLTPTLSKAPARTPAESTGGCFCGAIRYRAGTPPILWTAPVGR